MLESLEKEIQTKSQLFLQNFPGERVYLHTDRSIYRPGETIWFQTYLRNDVDLTPSNVSSILYVEWRNDKDQLIKKINLIAKGGSAPCQIRIPENQKSGLYTLKAYTEWQLNDLHPLLFEKNIFIQSLQSPQFSLEFQYDAKIYEPGQTARATIIVKSLAEKSANGIALEYEWYVGGEAVVHGTLTTNEFGYADTVFAIPTDLKTGEICLAVSIANEDPEIAEIVALPLKWNHFKAEFYPEGGDLVAGLPGRIATFISDDRGNPMETEGVLIKNGTEETARFRTNAAGFAVWETIPEHGPKYHVLLPETGQKCKFPNVLQRGYVLHAAMAAQRILEVTVYSPDAREVLLLAQMRGKLYFTYVFKCSPGENVYKYDTEALPAGVLELTLLDINGVERCERLIFINMDRVIQMKITPDKAVYLPREKATLTIETQNIYGENIQADVSLAVFSEKFNTQANREGRNLLSWFTLENDLTEPIENISRFIPQNFNSSQAGFLDSLLIKNHWRRFSWKMIRNEKQHEVRFFAEKDVIGGRVVLWEDNAPVEEMQPIADATVEMLGTQRIVKTDAKGYFLFENVALSAPVTLRVEHKKSGYNIVRTMSRVVGSAIDGILGSVEKKARIPEFIVEKEGITHYSDRILIILTEEGAQKPAPEDLDKASHLEEIVAETLANQDIKTSLIDSRHNRLAKLKALKRFKAQLLDYPLTPSPAIIAPETPPHPKIPFYHLPAPFPAPNYEKEQNSALDYRPTVYWQAKVQTGDKGRATVSFYLSDEIGDFMVEAQGIGKRGTPGVERTTFSTDLPVTVEAKFPQFGALGDRFLLELHFANRTPAPFEMNLAAEATDAFRFYGLPKTVSLPPQQSSKIDIEVETLKVGRKECFTLTLSGLGFHKTIEGCLTISENIRLLGRHFSGHKTEQDFDLRISAGLQEMQIYFFPNLWTECERYFQIHPLALTPLAGTKIARFLLQTLMQKQAPLPLQTNEEYQKEISGKIFQSQREILRAITNETNRERNRNIPPFFVTEAAYLLWALQQGAEFAIPQLTTLVPSLLKTVLDAKDGKGGFKIETDNPTLKDSVQAFIVFCLAETGNKGLEAEVNTIYNQSIKAKDSYQMALTANALFALKDPTRLEAMMNALLKLQGADGGWEGATVNFAGATGLTVKMEATALAILAMLRHHKPNTKALFDALNFIYQNRLPDGTFGSGHTELLVLTAVQAFYKSNKRTPEKGRLEVYANGELLDATQFDSAIDHSLEIKESFNVTETERAKIKVKFAESRFGTPYIGKIYSQQYTEQNHYDSGLSLRVSHKIDKNAHTLAYHVRLANQLPHTAHHIALRFLLPGSVDLAQVAQQIELPQPFQLLEVDGETGEIQAYLPELEADKPLAFSLLLPIKYSGTFQTSYSSAKKLYQPEILSFSRPETEEI